MQYKQRGRNMLEKIHTTAAIILAAGKASRYGSSKQLLQLNGKTLLEHSISNAIKVGYSPILIVSGAYHKKIATLSLPDSVTLIYNPDWELGMGNSLAHGAKLLDPESIDSLIIILADQPAVSPDTLQRLTAAFQSSDTSIVLSKNADSTGPPALFSTSHLPALCKLNHDEGAKTIVSQYPDQTTLIDAPESAWDIDTQETWQKFCAFSRV